MLSVALSIAKVALDVVLAAFQEMTQFSSQPEFEKLKAGNWMRSAVLEAWWWCSVTIKPVPILLSNLADACPEWSAPALCADFLPQYWIPGHTELTAYSAVSL